jgi:hypothetical protein
MTTSAEKNPDETDGLMDSFKEIYAMIMLTGIVESRLGFCSG